MKTFSVVLCVLLLCSVALCQETTQGVTVGMSYNQNGTPSIAGWGTYDKQITGNIFSYSGYDVTPLGNFLVNGSVVVPQLKFTAFSGFAVKTSQFGKMTLWLQGAGGMASTGQTTTGAGNFGGFVHYVIKNGWGLVVGVQGSYSPIAGTDALIRVGFRYGVK